MPFQFVRDRIELYRLLLTIIPEAPYLFIETKASLLYGMGEKREAEIISMVSPEYKYILQMPKAELHVHIEGTLEPEMIFMLAERNGVRLPYPDAYALKKAYSFQNLQDFLGLYYAGVSILMREQDFYDIMQAYLNRAAKEHVICAEIFFDPQAHM